MNTPVGIPNDRKDIESGSGYHKFLVGTLIARDMVVGCRFAFHHMYQHHLMILLFARKNAGIITIYNNNDGQLKLTLPPQNVHYHC